MSKIINVKWFTFVELIVALILSSIIFLFLMNFISKTFLEILYSKNKTNIITQVYEFEDEIWDLREKYNSWFILVDNDSWTWSDIFLLRNDNVNKWWYIVAQVNSELWVIDSSNNVDMIWNKVLALRKVSQEEIYNLLLVPNWVYYYKFNKDELYNNIKLKDLQIDLFNTWSLIEMTLDINPAYKIKLDWEKYSEIWTNNIEKIVINF